MFHRTTTAIHYKCISFSALCSILLLTLLLLLGRYHIGHDHLLCLTKGDIDGRLPVKDAPASLLKMHKVHDYFMVGKGSTDTWGIVVNATTSATATTAMATTTEDGGGRVGAISGVVRGGSDNGGGVDTITSNTAVFGKGPSKAVGPPRWPRGYSLTPHSAAHDLSSKWEKLTNEGCISSSHPAL
jgi:hypothetical protein